MSKPNFYRNYFNLDDFRFYCKRNKGIFYLENIIHKSTINWLEISWQYELLSDDFLEEYKDKIRWGLISIYKKLSLNTLIKFLNYLNLIK